jgi:hypothetical protein
MVGQSAPPEASHGRTITSGPERPNGAPGTDEPLPAAHRVVCSATPWKAAEQRSVAPALIRHGRVGAAFLSCMVRAAGRCFDIGIRASPRGSPRAALGPEPPSSRIAALRLDQHRRGSP